MGHDAAGGLQSSPGLSHCNALFSAIPCPLGLKVDASCSAHDSAGADEFKQSGEHGESPGNDVDDSRGQLGDVNKPNCGLVLHPPGLLLVLEARACRALSCGANSTSVYEGEPVLAKLYSGERFARSRR